MKRKEEPGKLYFFHIKLCDISVLRSSLNNVFKLTKKKGILTLKYNSTPAWKYFLLQIFSRWRSKPANFLTMFSIYLFFTIIFKHKNENEEKYLNRDKKSLDYCQRTGDTFKVNSVIAIVCSSISRITKDFSVPLGSPTQLHSFHKHKTVSIIVFIAPIPKADVFHQRGAVYARPCIYRETKVEKFSVSVCLSTRKSRGRAKKFWSLFWRNFDWENYFRKSPAKQENKKKKIQED